MGKCAMWEEKSTFLAFENAHRREKLHSHVGNTCAEVVGVERRAAGARGARGREARGDRGVLKVPSNALLPTHKISTKNKVQSRPAAQGMS